MPKFLTGVVRHIVQERGDLIRVEVEINGSTHRAAAFRRMTGSLAPGDRVVLNVTAGELDLGSGGEDFILWNLESRTSGEMSGGHIVKLRYSPAQIDVMAVEAPESPHHALLEEATDLQGMPVVACGLHSQLAGVAAGIRARSKDLNIAYVMTDGAALPISLSDTVSALVERGWVRRTITCGHAFGGDLEAVNIFSGLLAARHVAEADVAIVAMGPGVVGTGTLTGHTEMEQGQVLGAARALSGIPIACVRINLSETRERHRPVSHHTRSALMLAAPEGCLVALPELERTTMEDVMKAMTGVTQRHAVQVLDAGPGLKLLRETGFPLKTMGRGIDEVPEFFAAAVAAGSLAAESAR